MKVFQQSRDLFARKHDKEMSLGARLDWLAAAWEFVQMRKEKKLGKPGKTQAEAA